MRPWADDDAPADADAPDATSRRRGILGAIRVALAGYFDGFVLFSVLNVAVVLTALAVASAFAIVPAVIVLLPLAALPASALTAAAVEVARGRPPAWSVAAGELRRNLVRKLALATVQLAITGLGLLNLSMAAAVGGVAGVVIAGVGGYGLVVTWAYAVALWPIVADPHRDGPLRPQLRLALVVVVARPLGVAALVAVVAAAVTACALLIVPMIVLPALVILLCAAYVVPVADAFSPADGA